jgi:hypothetical protein
MSALHHRVTADIHYHFRGKPALNSCLPPRNRVGLSTPEGHRCGRSKRWVPTEGRPYKLRHYLLTARLSILSVVSSVESLSHLALLELFCGRSVTLNQSPLPSLVRSIRSISSYVNGLAPRRPNTET